MQVLKVTAYKFGNVVEIFDNAVMERGFGNCIEIDGSYCTTFEFNDFELVKNLFMSQGIELSLVCLFDNFVQYKVAQDPSFAKYCGKGNLKTLATDYPYLTGQFK